MMTPRRLQVCYVIVSQGWDRHAQMMWLSAHKLRLHEPNAWITLITDPESRLHLERSAGQLLGAVDQVVTAERPLENPQFRAFHIRTLMRRCIEGDFLHLDGDTLIVNRIAGALNVDAGGRGRRRFQLRSSVFPSPASGAVHPAWVDLSASALFQLGRRDHA